MKNRKRKSQKNNIRQGLRICLAAAALLVSGFFQAGADSLDQSLGKSFDESLNLDDILKSIDHRTNFEDTDYSAIMSMVIEDPENGIQKRSVQQFRRDSEDKFLMLILEPEDRKGQGYLRIGDNMWSYDPVSRKFSHTSMKDQFEGSDARNSDFRKSTTAEDYEVEGITEGTLGKYNVYILDLKAKHDEVSYPFVKIWVTQENHLVLKREEYSLTKRLMRTSLFPKYAKIGEKYVATQSIFIDELADGKKTQLTISDLSVEQLPDYVFTKAYVERVNK